MTVFNNILDDLRVADTEAILKVVSTEHRTNQQLLAKNIFAIVKHWSEAYEIGNYDARNEDTVKLAHMMVSGCGRGVDDVCLPYI